MGKSRNYDKELRLIDKLKHENAQLKRENEKLRRLNARNISLEAKPEKAAAVKKRSIKENKTCDECGKGEMKFFLIPRADGNFYLRACDLPGCGHKTRLKKYTKDVEES